MKVEFEVSSGKEALQRLVSSLFGQEEDAHSDDCHCVGCTAERMAQETYDWKPPSDEDMVPLLQRRILAVAKQAQTIDQRTQEMCAAMIEKPKRAEADNAMFILRMEEFNACVRCIRTLWAMLPEKHRVDLPEGIALPEYVTWEKALETRERIRGEIVEAVEAIHRDGKRSVGPELADLLKAALKRGRSREDVAEILQEAVNSISAPRSEQEEQPSPPAA